MKQLLATCLLLFAFVSCTHAKNEITAATLPTPELTIGKATLKGQLSGHNPQQEYTGKILVYNPITLEQKEYNIEINKNGTFESTIPVISTTSILLQIDRIFSDYIIVSPEKETSIRLDLQQKAVLDGERNKNKDYQPEWVSFEGGNAELNKEFQHAVSGYLQNKFSIQSILEDVYDNTPTQYKASILKTKKRVEKELTEKGLSAPVLEYAKIRTDHYALQYLLRHDYYLDRSFRMYNAIKGQGGPKKYQWQAVDIDYYDFLKDSYINNPLSFYSPDYVNAISRCKLIKNSLKSDSPYKNESNASVILAKILDTNQGILFDLLAANTYADKLKETTLSDSDIKQLAEIKNPFYQTYLTMLNNELLIQMERNKAIDGYIVHELADDITGENILPEIIKPFKGKVIFIDFWATWCAPCRAAMKKFAPVKKQYKGKDVAFIYITNQSSPQNTWENMIVEIPGEHYKLNKEQSKYLYEKFGIKGIPAYLILNKAGEKVYFKTGYDGESIVETLNQELYK